MTMPAASPGHGEAQLDPAAIVREAIDELYVIDSQSGHFLYANDAALRNTGYALEELRLMTPLDLQRGIDFETLTDRIAPLRRGEKSVVTFHTTYHRKDGTTYEVEHRVQFLRNHKPPVFVARARQVETPEAHGRPGQGVDDLYKRLVEEGDQGIWVADSEQRTTYVNEAMARMLGYTVEEIMGTSPLDFLDDEGRAIAVENLERRRRGERQRMEFKYIHRDGHEVWGLVAAHPMMDREGNYAGAFAFVADITQRRAQERVLLDTLHVKNPEELWQVTPASGRRPAVRMPSILGVRAARVARRFAILSDPRRLELIELLASEEERTVTELAEALQTTQSNVSKHLKVLFEAGLVSRHQEGTKTIYGLTDPTVAILCRIVYHWLGNQAESELQAFAS